VHPGSPATQTGRTTKLYDRRGQKVLLDELGRKCRATIYRPKPSWRETEEVVGAWHPKKKLRFKNKLLSLDATVIDQCLRQS